MSGLLLMKLRDARLCLEFGYKSEENSSLYYLLKGLVFSLAGFEPEALDLAACFA